MGWAEKVGGADRDRTGYLRLAKPALSQLSYSPNRHGKAIRRRAPGSLRSPKTKKCGGPKWT